MMTAAALFARGARTEVLGVPNPYPTIQSAIDAARSGDHVLVEPGTYLENLDFLGKSIRVRSASGADVTTIDGSGGGAVVRFVSGEDLAAVLEGFTLTGGTGEAPGMQTYGGGVFCDGSSPTIRENRIIGNEADHGGGICCFSGAHPSILANTIASNRAAKVGAGWGGGLYCADLSSPLVQDNVIEENSADNAGGAAVCFGGASPAFVDNVIRKNRFGPGLGWGGGILIMGPSSALVEGNLFEENLHGCVDCRYVTEGAIWIVDNVFRRNVGRAVTSTQSDVVRIERNRFTMNTGPVGVLGCYGSTIPIIGNEIVANDMLTGAGGIDTSGGSPLIANNLIAGNRSRTYNGAGGIRVGSGIGNSTPLILNNTIVGNRSVSGGIGASGILCVGGESLPTIANTIVHGNEGGPQIGLVRGGSPTLLHCVVEGGWSGAGEGNLDVDPGFVDRAGADYHLRIGSPCIDAGDDGVVPPSLVTDFEGDPRQVDGDGGAARVDIGADELLPVVAARFGTVGAAGESLLDVLFVNGSVGDRRRIVSVDPSDPLRVEVMAPAPGPSPARFALYLWEEAPDRTTLVRAPFDLGVTVFPTPLAGGPFNLPSIVWNNLGRRPRLGEPDLPSQPAPSVVVDRPYAALAPARFTLQGFIEDLGSIARGPASVTNAVVVEVVDR